jgi:hypothetical protein
MFHICLAVIALTAGVLGLATGIDAVHYTRATGLGS